MRYLCEQKAFMYSDRPYITVQIAFLIKDELFATTINTENCGPKMVINKNTILIVQYQLMCATMIILGKFEMFAME